MKCTIFNPSRKKLKENLNNKSFAKWQHICCLFSYKFGAREFTVDYFLNHSYKTQCISRSLIEGEKYDDNNEKYQR